jgi:hypothetical protein
LGVKVSAGGDGRPVLGAVTIVRPVGRCILTAPALRRRWPAAEEPAMRATSDDHRVISTPTAEYDLDNFIRGVDNPAQHWRKARNGVTRSVRHEVAHGKWLC